jgi:hypothetical protein
MSDGTSKKPAKPGTPTSIPKMIDVPPEQQEELRGRHDKRQEVTEALKKLAAVLKEWVRDLEMDERRFELFNAWGHKGSTRYFRLTRSPAASLN